MTTSRNDTYTLATGTSFAAPAVAGVVALMLEANPELGYRDIQQILAMSATTDGVNEDSLARRPRQKMIGEKCLI